MGVEYSTDSMPISFGQYKSIGLSIEIPSRDVSHIRQSLVTMPTNKDTWQH